MLKTIYRNKMAYIQHGLPHHFSSVFSINVFFVLILKSYGVETKVVTFFCCPKQDLKAMSPTHKTSNDIVSITAYKKYRCKYINLVEIQVYV